MKILIMDDKCKNKIKRSITELWKNPKYRKNQIKGRKGKNVGFQKGHKSGMTNKKHTSETILKMSKTKKGKQITWGDKIRLSLTGRKCTKTHKENISKSLIMRWKDNEYKERVGRKILKGLRKRPTSLETQMISMIDKYNLPYKYVGDGDFWIGGKNPDFIHLNEKILIEVANTYHHKPNYVDIRSRHFKKYGWKSKIFLTDKLNEKEVLSKLL